MKIVLFVLASLPLLAQMNSVLPPASARVTDVKPQAVQPQSQP